MFPAYKQEDGIFEYRLFLAITGTIKYRYCILELLSYF